MSPARYRRPPGGGEHGGDEDDDDDVNNNDQNPYICDPVMRVRSVSNQGLHIATQSLLVILIKLLYMCVYIYICVYL